MICFFVCYVSAILFECLLIVFVNFSEIRKRSYAETAQFQENFEVYIQALISQCLDGNFLDEVFSDQGIKIFISSRH